MGDSGAADAAVQGGSASQGLGPRPGDVEPEDVLLPLRLRGDNVSDMEGAVLLWLSNRSETLC